MHKKALACRLFRLQIALLATLLLSACWSIIPSPKKLTRFEFTRPEMGLPFRIVLYASDAPTAEAAARAAFDRIQRLNDILSDYDTDSELSRLSQTAGTGQAVSGSDEMWFVPKPAQVLVQRTDGEFDVNV